MSEKRFLPKLLVIGALWLMPTSALAFTTQLYDLRSGEINADWEGLGDISMQRSSNGILLTTGSSTGYLLTDTQMGFHPDVAEIALSAPRPTTILFIWSFPDDAVSETSFIEIGTHSENEGRSRVLLHQHEDWKMGKKRMGLLIPPNTSVLVQHIQFYKWNGAEKLMSMMRSLVTFDELRPYAINFVWGPYVSIDPLSVREIYDQLPPMAISVTKMANILIVVMIVIVLIGRSSVGTMLRRWLPLKRAITIMIGVWLVFDLYIGTQFLTWVFHDHQTFISRASGLREFRDRDHFYDFAEFAQQFIVDRDRYIFVAETPWPYLGNMRYLTYPSIPAFNIETDDTWVIYNRTDFGINEAGQLVVDGIAITQPGQLVGAFDEDSFVFRGSPPIPTPENE